MKIALALCISILLPIATAPVTAGIEARPSTTAPVRSVPASQPAGPARGAELAALEQKLLRTWTGPDCGGDFTFKADGTFEVQHYSPGNNTFAGTWSLRWDALPPTLLLTFKTSDYKKRNPSGPEYKYVGKTLEAKLLELNSDVLAFQVANTEWNWRNLPAEN
jgi:hypothetical protein